MNSNGATPKIVTLRCNPDATGTHFRERRDDVEYNEDGIPIVLHVRCRNRECCPRSDDDYGVHLFTLYGVQNGKPIGQYITVRVSFGNVADLPLGARVVSGGAQPQ